MNPSPLRIKILLVLFFIFGFLILTRLFYWQVVKADQLSSFAKAQQQVSQNIQAIRGSILSSDGYPLATPADGWLLWAAPDKIDDLEKAAKSLAQITAPAPLEEEATSSSQVDETEQIKVLEETKKSMIKTEESRLVDLLLKKDVVWVALKHKIANKEKEEIENLKIEGLGFDEEQSRAYPEGIMASHLLGFVGKNAAGEDKGYFGLEGFYDLTLQGSKGYRLWEKDAQGIPILLGSGRLAAALNGLSLQTTINRSVQFIIEKHLAQGVKKYNASGGTVVVMRPNGAILGMASYPFYNPSSYAQYSDERFIDPAISLSFEPGSIFKPLVMASALDAAVVKPETKCSECSGPVHIAEYTIETGTKKYYPDSTMGEIIEHSDNVGMVWVAEQLGQEKMYDYLVKFGLGQLSGIDLQGEATPNLRKKDKWGLIDLATASFGQGVAVTPIQMVRAIAAIANKGLLPKPHLVESLSGEGLQQKLTIDKGQEIVSEKAASQVTQMMVNNVESRDDWSKPLGIKLAGKTGTAQIPIAGHYDPNKTIHSFVGFGPSDNPQFIMLVTLKDPRAYEFAAQTAAPLWFDITREILPLLRMP